MPARAYPLLILLAVISLLAGLWAGLARLGWPLLSHTADFSLLHGPLMIAGFLGTLVTLERAVAIRRGWMFAAPLLAGAGALAAGLLPTVLPGAILMLAGSTVSAAIALSMARREPAWHTRLLLGGMLAWWAGQAVWLVGRPVFQAVLLWQAFLVLTITGERLELNRVLGPRVRQRGWLLAALVGYLAGVLLSPAWADGARLAGAGLALLAGWLLRQDLAARNLRHRLPLTRYIAWCLFLGFVWLGVGGALHLAFGQLTAGPRYDAALHAVFVGFVLSMIFGHAPIIFPAVLRRPLAYRRYFYAPLVALHASLALRLLGGLADVALAQRWGGLLNEVALLAFLGSVAVSLWAGRKTPSRPLHGKTEPPANREPAPPAVRER